MSRTREREPPLRWLGARGHSRSPSTPSHKGAEVNEHLVTRAVVAPSVPCFLPPVLAFAVGRDSAVGGDAPALLRIAWETSQAPVGKRSERRSQKPAGLLQAQPIAAGGPLRMCCPATRTSAGPAHGHRVVLVVPKREREEWRLQGKAVLLGASLGASPPPGRRMRSPMIAEAQRIYPTFLSRAAQVPFLLVRSAQPVAPGVTGSIPVGRPSPSGTCERPRKFEGRIEGRIRRQRSFRPLTAPGDAHGVRLGEAHCGLAGAEGCRFIAVAFRKR